MNSAQSRPTLPTIRLFVVNLANVQADMLKAAESDATTIYRAAGVQTQWRHAETDGQGADRDEITVILFSSRQNPQMTSHVSGSAMGFVADNSRDDANQTAYALYDRIETSAGMHHLSVSRLLGEVIAHEVGHVLLAVGAHSDRGIMSAEWDLHSGMLEYFTSAQAEVIRHRLTLRADAMREKR
jgi:hypothetical protein